MIRRRRIRYAANQNDKSIKTSPSKYHRFHDDEHNGHRHDNVTFNHRNETPPPSSFINDKYLDNLIHAENKNTNKKEEVMNENDKSPFDERFNSMEHSISYPPLTEFSQDELSLRASSSEFFLIDGVAIHYCLERNYDESIGDDKPWLVLLHGFGGGVFSWKQSMALMLTKFDNQIQGILAFDRVGFGLTERPLTETSEESMSGLSENTGEMDPYSMQFSLKILKTFLDKFEMQKSVIIGHSTGCLVANWFAFHYPQYIKALILISPTHGMPAFIRSILNTKLGKPIILSLVRSEIGQVTLHRAWHDPNSVPAHIISAYKQVLKLKNWNESLLRMSQTEPYSKMEQYHKCLSKIDCPVWLLHGDDDKLVTFRESLQLAAL